MSEPRIDRVVPAFAADASDEQLLAWYDEGAAHSDGRPWVRMNFVSSIDGAVTRDGRSGGLGTPADRRVFDLLRLLADVVLVGAGTVRKEGYGAMRLPDDAVRWRLAHGLAAQPVFAIVSAELALFPDTAIFENAPVRPLVFTTADAPDDQFQALSAVSDVVVAGDDLVEPSSVLEELQRRGLRRVHCEGGPTLAGLMLADGVIDEFCLTVTPTLEGGDAGRITGEVPSQPQSMRLAQALHSEGTLLLRYVRDRRDETSA
ncbi:pyrimidine reductase family protein [Gryllotalpicola ginsengisoli]|uniref:pyrimidine reductase family protein n=1 Tax=Gryllotalpicola ginsengisoli TaxID=444608 RepID=UPI0003B57F6F|nr:pyrimidine reductase family protein [Gryllotalpicola ginsengisoli]